ncbi:peptidase, partial [bacterium]|nr:peptidase [bacterium]
VCVVDHEESQKLETIGNYLNDMEANLPLPNQYKNFERGTSSPIKIVNELFTAGDTKAGIQTTAFNLPNDERVREAKGSKKVMLKNVMDAKFEKCWIPIVNTILAEKDLNRVSFDGYFNHVLMHEISHGLGPGNITMDGRETTVNKELKELYSTIEECKADILGILNTQFLIDKKVLPKELENTLYASYLGGMFRSIRFGIGEAHGGGVAIQLNYCLDKGAFRIDKDGKFSVNNGRIKSSLRDLASETLLIQAEGNYEGAKQLVEKYRVVRPEVQSALNKLEHVPIDIRPIYPIENNIE